MPPLAAIVSFAPAFCSTPCIQVPYVAQVAVLRSTVILLFAISPFTRCCNTLLCAFLLVVQGC